MHIDLGRIEIGMSQPLLELKGRDAFLGFLCCKGVPKGVAAGTPGDPCILGVFDDELSNAPFGDGGALVVEKECRGDALGACSKVISQGLDPSLLKGDFPLNVSFAPNGDCWLGKVNV